MSELPRTPYHIGDQSAATLLGPVTLELARLEGRLANYVERLHMPPADRQAVDRARAVLTDALANLRAVTV